MDCITWPLWQINLLEIGLLLLANIFAITFVVMLVRALKVSLGPEVTDIGTVKGRRWLFPLLIICFSTYGFILTAALWHFAGLLCGPLGVPIESLQP